MPPSGRSRPTAIDSDVVLPAPFGPTRPKNDRPNRQVDVIDGDVVAEPLEQPGELQRRNVIPVIHKPPS
jgi:hypothetical protein